ncbi:MAG: 16S rRNA (guanine(966)-N(2))-methyltransferase RsmD [Nitrospirae bacterium]|nr:16S rRNA (guanine(966)-N(2))-methyltransferase RsmD [Nitrospirota bacterium]
MRISAGTLKGRRLLAKTDLRPTAGKVRESLFNILGERIQDSIFIDLYAGTGAVGIEAMSRGALRVFFVESNKKAVDALKKTLEGCGCRARANIINKKVSSFVKSAIKEELKADIIFLDPPYYSEELENILPLLSEGDLIGKDAIIMAEHPSKKTLPDKTGVLTKKKTYRYGDTALTLYKVVK